MITFLLITGLVISMGFNAAAYILVSNILKKNSIYEEWILDFKTDVINTVEQMRVIDKQGVFATSLNDKGIFESDDQVGGIFKELTALVEKLNERTQ